MSRRVRVTLEGDAHGFPGSDVLRVFVGASQCVTVDPSWPHVSVEDVEPPRVWTDGDVVQGVQHVWTRHGTAWHTPAVGGVLTDALVSEGVGGCEQWTPLRYQHGDA